MATITKLPLAEESIGWGNVMTQTVNALQEINITRLATVHSTFDTNSPH